MGREGNWPDNPRVVPATRRRGDRVKRRVFIALLGGAAAWPLAAQAQITGERMRRVGLLMPYPETETDIQTRVRALKEELQRLGWTEGSKIEFDERWTADNMELVRSNAASLVESKPDAIVTTGGRVIPILKQMTRSDSDRCHDRGSDRDRHGRKPGASGRKHYRILGARALRDRKVLGTLETDCAERLSRRLDLQP